MKIGIFLLFGGLTLFAADTAAPSTGGATGGVIELTALSAVIAGLAYLLKFHIPKILADAREEREEALKSYTATLDKITERHDSWEKLRHADHEAQQETLREMTRQCANVHTQIQERANERSYPPLQGMDSPGH